MQTRHIMPPDNVRKLFVSNVEILFGVKVDFEFQITNIFLKCTFYLNF